MVAICYHADVVVNMHLRDVPDDVHAELARRAARAGMSLRQYTIDVLVTHCGWPTVDDWLDRLAQRRAHRLREHAAEAVRQSRADDDRRAAGG